MNRSTDFSMYYVAIVCPDELNKKVLQYKHWMKEQFGCLVALKSPAHITLVPPFWLEETRETGLHQAVQLFNSDMIEIEIELDGFSHFAKKVLFIRVKSNAVLNEIKKQAEMHFIETFGNSIRADNGSFHPHVTIASRDLKPSDFFKAWQHFSTMSFNAIFRTKTISLLKLSPDKWNVISPKSLN